MRNRNLAWAALLAGAVLGGALTGRALAQFSGPDTAVAGLHLSAYPADIQHGFGVFKTRCSECHGLSSSLSIPSSAVDDLVSRMRAMPSSHLTEGEAHAVVAFLTYVAHHHQAASPSSVAAANDGNGGDVEAGRKFYEASGCDTCHSIRGQGNTAVPLDGVASRMSREDLIKRLQGPVERSMMPPLPRDTSVQQIDELAAYLLTLKGR